MVWVLYFVFVSIFYGLTIWCWITNHCVLPWRRLYLPDYYQWWTVMWESKINKLFPELIQRERRLPAKMSRRMEKDVIDYSSDWIDCIGKYGGSIKTFYNWEKKNLVSLLYTSILRSGLHIWNKGWRLGGGGREYNE